MSDSILNDLNPVTAFALWGYDLRGAFVEEFAATIAEGTLSDRGMMWDHPEWLEDWYSDGRPYTPPFVCALPWVTDYPPTRCMFRPKSQWDAELAR